MLLPLGYSCRDEQLFSYSYAYFLEGKDDLVLELESRGASVQALGARGNLSIFFKIPELRQYLRREKIDLIHAHLPIAGVAARLAALPLGIPVVYTEHNLMERYHPVTRFLNRYTFGMQKAAIAVSEDVAQSIHKHAPNKTLVRTITNGIDAEAFSRKPKEALQLKKRLGIPEDALVIGMVAVFREQKQLPVWVKVASALAKEYEKVFFLLVGSGPLQEQVKQLVSEEGLEKRLLMPGLVREDMVDWYSAMDIFFMSSRFEGLPLALLEAMAAGCSIVATRVGGVPEVIADAVHGRLVPYDDPHAMKEALGHYLQHPEDRKKEALAAVERVKEAFSIQRMTQEIETLYLEILRKKAL